MMQPLRRLYGVEIPAICGNWRNRSGAPPCDGRCDWLGRASLPSHWLAGACSNVSLPSYWSRARGHLLGTWATCFQEVFRHKQKRVKRTRQVLFTMMVACTTARSRGWRHENPAVMECPYITAIGSN